ncbi:MAG: crotonase/enoyl-CoA hydratase family protein [Ilumatobacteraceae bacterium]|jgi:enoyl-CoA hydratase/carnithine racemase|nr:crotonase/enoyl-CoA hydratase family protein [Ilumatobacteraceae bacterium]MDP4713301.1 crotonase/enoyl-CoA hydratase family protein [Ilumatobacteraceae bacterium]MDP5114032.1 crotonase/enoyl-CoA hydratase family protein [Ilumatobacteraceae bacterium]
MAYEEIIYDVSEQIATITLNRPDKLNSFTNRMLKEIIAAFDESDADDNVRAVIVTGSGRAFCAGADLSGGGETFAKGGSDVKAKTGVMRDGGGLVSLRIFESKKPVIGAINGAAVGVGVTMTLPMDIRLASTTSKFGFVFAKRGIVPEAASSWFLPRIVGISQATEWCFTGRMISAEDAKEARLVRSVHAPEDLLSAAREIAREIAENTAPVSVALSRQMLWRMLGADHPMQAHRVDSRAINSRGASDDAREGVMSFLEKRPADFPVKVSDGLPEVFPDWQDPQFS